jgi:hypothetical protein
MEKVYYKTEFKNGVELTTTKCERRKNFIYNVGSRFCLSCSYCYDINTDLKYVVCRKIISGCVPKGN